MDRSEHIAFERTGSGTPMLLIHGLPATHTLWEPLVPALAACRTVYAIDLPGFGASTASEENAVLSLPRLVEMLIAFIDRMELQQFDLVGHSFGSAVSASIAAEIPSRINSLVLLTPMSFEKPPLVRLARTAALRAVASAVWRVAPSAMRRLAIRRVTQLNYGPAFVDTRAQQLAEELDRDDLVRSAHRLIGAFDFAEYRLRLDRLERSCAFPMLALGARCDRVIPYRHFEALCDVLASAEHETFDDGVHVVMWQHPDDVARRIVDFVERNRIAAVEPPMRG